MEWKIIANIFLSPLIDIDICVCIYIRVYYKKVQLKATNGFIVNLISEKMNIYLKKLVPYLIPYPKVYFKD